MCNSLVEKLSLERDSIVGRRLELISEIERLQSSQAQIEERLSLIEKLLTAYGVSTESTLGDSAQIDASRAETDSRKLARPSLIPPYDQLGPIDAIGKRMRLDPEKVFKIEDFIEPLFGLNISKEEYAAAKRSITAEASRGAKEGRWDKLPQTKGKYRYRRDSTQKLAEDIGSGKSPKQMKRSKFSSMSYIDIVTELLKAKVEGYDLNDLTNLIFITENLQELKKCEGSLSVELNRAIREERLIKDRALNRYFLPR
jgi:hypothetical protein